MIKRYGQDIEFDTKLRELSERHQAALKEKDEELAQFLQMLVKRDEEIERITRKTWCAYCGFEIERDSDAAEKISEHIGACRLHPMRVWERQCEAVEEQNQQLKEEIKRLAEYKAKNYNPEESIRLNGEILTLKGDIVLKDNDIRGKAEQIRILQDFNNRQAVTIGEHLKEIARLKAILFSRVDMPCAM
jgi:hypothetical protein